jgi:4'-phosphopantetheinyl transferase
VGRLAEPRISETVLAAVRLSAVDLGLVDMLDDAERNLAAAIHSSAQRDRFLAGRIALRLHAAKVAGVSPGSLQADYLCPNCRHQDKAHGMPRYQVLPPGLPIRVSLSKSGDWCLLAGTTDDEIAGVGVDVESEVSAGFDGFETVGMTARERDQLQRMSPSLKARFQTLLWVRKEAVLKALGSGLAVDPSLVDVSGPVPLVPGRRCGSEVWLIEDVSPGSVGLPDNCTAVLALLRRRRQAPREESDCPAFTVLSAAAEKPRFEPCDLCSPTARYP